MSSENYDGILINTVLIPLKVGSLTVDAVTQRVVFTLSITHGAEQAVAAISKCPLAQVYHPQLAKAGVSYLTITHFSLPERVEDRWHVRVEGLGNDAPKYVRYFSQAGPVEEDQEERRNKYIAWIQKHGVHLRLGPLLIRAVSWPFIVMKLNTLYRENSHTDCVVAFAKTFDMPLEDAREAVAFFMGQVNEL